MIDVKVKIKEGAKLPIYQTKNSAGADICAFIDQPVIIKPFERKLIPTGIFLEIPEGYEAQIRPRSGLAINHGITLLNTPGTIDSDYRGEIKIILINLGNKDFTITNGMRIAQMIFSQIIQSNFIVVDSLSATDRGEGGFGHTGL